MKRVSIIGCFVVGLIFTLLARPAFAILGIGDIVFDPSVYAQAVRELVQLEQQYQQLVQTYVTIRSQYAQMIWMAQRVPVNAAVRYRAIVTPWRASSATNTYGTTSGWMTGINTGLGVAAGYAQATEALATYGTALNALPSDQIPRVRTSYATVELADGANLAAMDTVGRLRANAPAVEMAIQGLEDDSLSPDPAMNTEVALLEKINAAHLITVRNTQDANKLLVALAEEQITESKRKRDAEALAISNHVRFLREGKAVIVAQAAGASDAMLAWRMP
jgi:hypothetical protein